MTRALEALEELNTALTEKQLDLLQHALGVTVDRESYRNYFAATPGSPDEIEWQKICHLGYGRCWGQKPEIFGKLIYYSATAGGESLIARRLKIQREERKKQWLKLSRAKRRYKAYLESETSETFGEWLQNSYWDDYRRKMHA